MKISADFDSGNIEVKDASNPRHVLLAMRPDLRSHHFQWFHFKVDGMTPGSHHDFSLVNAGQSAYAHAWTGYNAAASYDQVNWFRVPSRFDENGLHFGLEPTQSHIWFAYFEPYSRARHDALIRQAVEAAGAEIVATGKSLEGRDIPLLKVSRNPQAQRRVWIIAQQHPGEHMAEWFMEGIIERLKQRQDPELERLLDAADLYLVPNMNPDGAYRGHLRTNAAGKDLNRAWQSASEAETPEVHFVQQQMRRIGVDLFLDIHGDEEIPHVFTAGCEGNPGYTPRLGHPGRRVPPPPRRHGRRVPDPLRLPPRRARPGQHHPGLQRRRPGVRLPVLHHRNALQGPRRQPRPGNRLERQAFHEARPGRAQRRRRHGPRPALTPRPSPATGEGVPGGAPPRSAPR